MAGLLDGVLPYIYSRSDAMKRQLSGALSDPMGTFAQTAGLIQDKHNEQQGLMGQAFADPARPFNVTNQQALGQAANNMMSGPMGFAPVGMMAGIGAKTADAAALAVAQKRLSAGDDPAKVWAETGWGRGPDGKMRFEIDDSAAKFRGTGSLQRATDAMSHKTLFDAYPNMNEIGVRVDPFMKEGGSLQTGLGMEQLGIGTQNQTSSMLHELQHAVQTREGFAKGGTPESAAFSDVMPRIDQVRAEKAKLGIDPYAIQNKLAGRYFVPPEDLAKYKTWEGLRQQEDALLAARADPFAAYQRQAGEAEARLTQSRMDMTAQQRAQQYPWAPDYFKEATGTPLDSLIFR